MSSNLLPYKFKSREWHKADGINESDVAVIIDPSRNLIWYYEGRSSSARKRNKARESLGDLKKEHATYKFNKVNRATPHDIMREFLILKENYYINTIKNLKIDVAIISKSYFYLNSIGGLLNIICFIFSLLFLFNLGVLILDGFQHYSITFSNFQYFILLLSIFSLFSFIFYIISAIITSMFKQKIATTFNIVGSILSFLAFFQIYIWDALIYTTIVYQQIYIRTDVFILFNINIQTLLIISMVIAFIMGSIGFRRVDRIINDEDED